MWYKWILKKSSLFVSSSLFYYILRSICVMAESDDLRYAPPPPPPIWGQISEALYRPASPLHWLRYQRCLFGNIYKYILATIYWYNTRLFVDKWIHADIYFALQLQPFKWNKKMMKGYFLQQQKWQRVLRMPKWGNVQ